MGNQLGLGLIVAGQAGVHIGILADVAGEALLEAFQHGDGTVIVIAGSQLLGLSQNGLDLLQLQLLLGLGLIAGVYPVIPILQMGGDGPAHGADDEDGHHNGGSAQDQLGQLLIFEPAHGTHGLTASALPGRVGFPGIGPRLRALAALTADGLLLGDSGLHGDLRLLLKIKCRRFLRRKCFPGGLRLKGRGVGLRVFVQRKVLTFGAVIKIRCVFRAEERRFVAEIGLQNGAQVKIFNVLGLLFFLGRIETIFLFKIEIEIEFIRVHVLSHLHGIVMTIILSL